MTVAFVLDKIIYFILRILTFIYIIITLLSTKNRQALFEMIEI